MDVNSPLKLTIGTLILFISLILIFIYTTSAQEANLTKNNNITLDKINDNTPMNQLIQVIGILASIALGTIGTRYVVNKWQQQKETSEIRKEILTNYQESIKDYLILMETFVAKIVFRLLMTNDTGYRIDNLDKILPFGYTYDPLEYIVKEVQNQNFSFSNRNEVNIKAFFDSEFKKFQEEFFRKRSKVTKFTSGVRQYYQDGKNLYRELDKLWGKIMLSHILLQMIMRTENEESFVSLLKQFSCAIEQCFEDAAEYDYKLAKAKIRVG
jgi:hypothetical protein